MPTITIREQSFADNQFAATVSFNHQTEYAITVSDPFTAKQERQLEWYFEEWLLSPYTDRVRADEAAASVGHYGETLFDQVFDDRRVYSQYQAMREDPELRIEIVGRSPAFQGLHWEALKDPDQPLPLAVSRVMVRQRSLQAGEALHPVMMAVSPVIRVLVITARPDEEADVGYRTISRPLIESLQNAHLPVQVELLRPATYAALVNHLEETGTGHYHIVHFDGHGSLLTYAQYRRYLEQAQSQSQPRYTFQMRYGRSDLAAYEGTKAFLFLEGEEKGQADPVEAREMAQLLVDRGIPVCILNACQSGKMPTSGEPGDEIAPGFVAESSLGSRLMAAGLQLVLAMGYSVTVSAAKALMTTLYQHLFSGKDLAEAVRRGRLELYNHKERRGWFNTAIDLEDWMLPIAYANGRVELNLRDFTPQEESEYWTQQGTRYHFAAPTYGFVGRDLEILKLEKGLLRHTVLLLKGMGGTGKTTLLQYLRDWWQTTQWIQDSFYFGYDEKAWTLAQMVFAIGARLYNTPA